MTRIFLAVLLALTAVVPRAEAQDVAWVQVEARPSPAQAEERARDYAARIEGVAGFRLPGRWHAIVVGPFDAATAPGELARLRQSGQIPNDAYIVSGNNSRDQFWPVGGSITTQPLQPLGTITETAAVPQEPAPEPVPAEETLSQSRASERALLPEERRELQEALAWEGFYNSTIDGLFGPGTRRSMSAWQSANGFETTGILSTAQRRQLLEGYRAVLSGLGQRLVFDREAGIEIELPMNAVAFSSYNAPFARYDAKVGSGPQVLLISQSGDGDTLASLYNVLQTLELMPLDGPRTLRRRSFTIEGTSSQISSFIYGELVDGTVKGFALVWPSDDLKRRDLVLTRMRQSFGAVPGTVLPDNAGADVREQSIDMLAGLEIRTPDASRSGFFVSADGKVLTSADVVASCGRITLDGETEASVTAREAASGIVLLTPNVPLAPLARAQLASELPRLQSEIAVSGYSYEGVLGAPTVTYGSLSDIRGLKGEPELRRLALLAQPGDAGGPILDVRGSVLGMLLPAPEDGRDLPPEVSLAVGAEVILRFLEANGVVQDATPEPAPIDSLDLTIRAADMTVLVSCWN